MQFNYDELETIERVLRTQNNHDLADKAKSMCDEFWNAGTTMPPLGVKVLVESYNPPHPSKLYVVRSRLLSSYSGKEGGYRLVNFKDPSTNEEYELDSRDFRWRRL